MIESNNIADITSYILEYFEQKTYRNQSKSDYSELH